MNMSYCRFENTVRDLQDCLSNISQTEDLSRREAAARKELIELCIEIAEMYPDAASGDYGPENDPGDNYTEADYEEEEDGEG